MCACLPSAAGAAPRARLTAKLTPEHLGGGTTVGFTLRVLAPADTVPPPLTEVDLRYPRNLGFATSGLGLEPCAPARLEAFGPRACPPDSVMGVGSAVAEIAVGPGIVHERAYLSVYRAPTENGRIAMLFYANGRGPLETRVLLPSLLLAAPAPFGGRVRIDVPLIPGLPETPDVAVVRLTAMLGPLGVSAYEEEYGRTATYRPRGVQLPDSCPRGGFPFAAQLSFLGGGSATAQTVVACPGARARRHARG